MSALEFLAGLVLDDGHRWGQVAHRFQWEDAEALLEPAEGGPRRHWWTRPRGASKTGDGAGCGLAVLAEQMPEASWSGVYAADRDQAGLVLESIDGFLRRTPELGSALSLQASQVVNQRTGARLTIESSDDASAFGKRPQFQFVDEFGIWKTTRGPRQLWKAVRSAVPKVKGSRLLVASMGGDPAHPAYKVLERARVRPSWRVSEVPGPCPWWSAEDVEEERDGLTDTDFERLILGRWVAGEDRLTSPEDVRACVGHEGPLEHEAGHRYAMSLDLGLVNDRTVLSVGHVDRFDDADLVVLDRQHVWQGSRSAPVQIGDVEAVVLEAWSAYGRPPLVLDPWQGKQLAQRLRARGVRVVEFTFSQASIGRLAATLYRLLRGQLLDLPDDEDLLAELETVRLLETAPGVWRIDHDAGQHDDRVVSLAMLAHHLLDRPRRRQIRAVPDPEVDPWAA